MRILTSGLLGIFSFLGCQRNKDVPVPDTRWDLFENPGALWLNPNTVSALEGVYIMDKGREMFGDTAVAKLSYTIQGQDTIYHLSLFFEKDISYFICQGKQMDDTILLKGYWRKMGDSETGTVRLTITPANGAGELLKRDPDAGMRNLHIEGSWGKDENLPDQPIRLSYQRPLYKGAPLEIVAHRGGGRNTDFLPSSENSLELILRASRFGATGVEIDIQFTKDGIPILYHDQRINDRLTQKSGIRGLISRYSFSELEKVRLKKGEKIPTLRQALQLILEQTPLRFVWIDAKEKTGLERLHSLQSEFTRAAASAGKKLEIILGIPDEEVYNQFKSLPTHKMIPSLCELEPEKAQAIEARIWANMWIKGLKKEEVATMHAQGRKAFAWTIDDPEKIREFMIEGGYDGIVSNYPSLIAYNYYLRK